MNKRQHEEMRSIGFNWIKSGSFRHANVVFICNQSELCTLVKCARKIAICLEFHIETPRERHQYQQEQSACDCRAISSMFPQRVSSGPFFLTEGMHIICSF